MVQKGRLRRRGTLRYPKHAINPEDLLHFVELDEFADDWKCLGLDDEEDMWALSAAIMVSPEGPPVIRGTGGLRKLRFAPADWSTGKRGAVRVCYVYFPQYFIVLLCAAYSHLEKDNLSAKEKAGIRQYISECQKWLSSRAYK
jgi:hypothetical protein